MAYQKKKIIYLVALTILMLLLVGLLYPFGDKLLKKIRDHYSPPVYGKEIIYSDIDSGDIKIADGILNNKYEISRFAPVVIDKITWKENPYDDIYWRFNYYNLEPVRNLLFAWEETNKNEYKDKLIEIVESFIDEGADGPYSWDFHGAAFRTMTLIDVRAKLLSKNALSTQLDDKIQASLKIHGDFLADPAHFESDYNHGLDQSAALYLLAINFPDMPGSSEWLRISSKRIVEMENNLIDKDGVLVENSPYYHFYVLEKFLEISKYLKQNNLEIRDFSEEKIKQMISYASYILQPDLSVPTIGASIGEQINLFGLYKEISADNPELLYVLTKGDQGVEPANLSIQYPSSGETIMRSGWGRGDDFTKQTQLIFDVGEYRTNHSDLDALSFNLFGAGIALMPDAGLYTYEDGAYRSYFHGTRSHNTVLVDGKDQNIGFGKSVFAGVFKQGDGFVYQTGEENLNNGVTHKRAIVMIEDSTVLILDDLESSKVHKYEQMFHLFPGAGITSDGLTVVAKGNKPEQTLSIEQLGSGDMELQTTIGQTDPPDGLCSVQYKVAVPCYSISYVQNSKNASYVTAINIGKNTNDINFSNNVITVKTSKGEYQIKVNESGDVDRSIEVDKKTSTFSISSVLKLDNALNIFSNWQKISGANGPKPEGAASTNNLLELITPYDGLHAEASIKTELDLSKENIYFKFKVSKTQNLQGFEMYLSNDNWKKTSKINVKSFIVTDSPNQNGEWIQFGVAKGELRDGLHGGWTISDGTFDWSNVDGIKLVATSKIGQSITIDVKEFALAPDQSHPRAVIVFDDGWESVLDAAKVMNIYGIKGNIAVISNSVGSKRYLTLDNLKTIQNDYGWDLANHSSLHKNAILSYVDTNNIKGFEKDVVDGLQYLIKNDLNSAPNWYIYPDGSRDSVLDEIIGKYYKFARSTIDAPSSSPFANPYSVTTLSIYSDDTTPVDVHNAVSDAIKYDQTLFLMFHKISLGAPTEHTEYSLKDFESTIKDIKKQGIRVITLSELDKENGVPETNFTLNDAASGQYTLDVSVNHPTNKFQNAIITIWRSLKNIGSKII